MKNPWVFFLFVLGFFGCDVINPSDPVPSYISVTEIKIDSFRSEPNSAAVFDVWVTVNGDYVGTYEVQRDPSKDPLVFPVLYEGNVEIGIFGGVYRDYTFGRHDPYIFYKEYITNVELTKTEVTVVNPTISYLDEGQGGIQFPRAAFDDFEPNSGFTRYEACSGCLIPMQIIDPDSLNGGPAQGEGAAYFRVDEDDDNLLGMIQRTRMSLPIPPTQVFFEMDFNSNVKILVSFRINGIAGWPIITLPPTTGDYRKVYIFITDDIGFAGQGDLSAEFQMFITSLETEGVEGDKYASFDNLRIVQPN